jgi:hypothetical protein
VHDHPMVGHRRSTDRAPPRRVTADAPVRRPTMPLNPLDERGIPVEEQFRSWSELTVTPYDKHDVHPYTRTRVILMNGIEVESIMFSHQFARHTDNPEILRALALSRRVDQQQQKVGERAQPRRPDAARDHDRLRAGGGRPHRVARTARARPDAEAGARLRPARGLRPPVPVRRPVRPDRRGKMRPSSPVISPRSRRVGPRTPTTATRTTGSAGTTPRTPSIRCRACT